LKKVSYKKSSY